MANVSTYNCGGCGGGGGNAYPALSRLFVNSIEPCTHDGTITMNLGQLVVNGGTDTTSITGDLQVSGTTTLTNTNINGNITQTSGETTLDELLATEIQTQKISANEIDIGYFDQVRFVSDEDQMGFYITDEDGLPVTHFTNSGISTTNIEQTSGTTSLKNTSIDGDLTIINGKDLIFSSATSNRILIASNLYIRSGASNRFTFASAGNQFKMISVGMNEGSSTPEGAVNANPGHIYLRTGGAADTSIYFKETGTGNTGWKARNEFTNLIASNTTNTPALFVNDIYQSAGDASFLNGMIMMKDDTNRLGIGTATPTEALDVVGNIKSSGSIVANAATLSSLSLTGNFTVDTNVLSVDSSTNKVGINITNPDEALDVVGNIKASGTTQCVSLIQTTPALYIKSNNANQAIPASTTTTVLFGSTSVNDQSVITYSATPGTWTSNAQRVVEVSYTILWASNGTAASNRQVYIQTCSSCTPPNSRLGEVTVQTSAGSSNTVLSGTAIFKMPINGFFTINAWQNSTASCNIVTPSFCHVLIL